MLGAIRELFELNNYSHTHCGVYFYLGLLRHRKEKVREKYILQEIWIKKVNQIKSIKCLFLFIAMSLVEI